MLQIFVALALVVVLMLGYLALVQLVVDPHSVLWRTRARLRESARVRREVADLDREYASLVDEYRDYSAERAGRRTPSACLDDAPGWGLTG